MSNTIKVLFTSNYCCSEPDAELYTFKMFSPLPEEQEEERDEDDNIIEPSPVVYSDEQKKTLELYEILKILSNRDSRFNIEDIKHLIVSYEVIKANEDNDERRIGCDFYLGYTVC
jgi:hypothetical protein